MMHNRAGRKLRRTTSHRLAMFSNQLDSLMTHERIQTTLSKAKELRPLAEKLITAGKNDGDVRRRKVSQWIPDRTTVKKVFEKIAPRFVDRPGGYTRILRLGSRQGDGAEMAVLELVERAAAEATEPVKESKAPKATGGSPKLQKPNKRVDDEPSSRTRRKARRKPRRRSPPRRRWSRATPPRSRPLRRRARPRPRPPRRASSSPTAAARFSTAGAARAGRFVFA